MRVTDSKQVGRVLTPQQRGAAITNSGRSPIASLSAEARNDMLEMAMARFLADEKLGEIAPDIGVSQPALCMALLRYKEDDWLAVQQGRALAHYEQAKEALDSAADPLSLARARDQVRTRQWELERLLKRLYGTQPEPQERGTIAIQINFAGDGAVHSGSAQARPDPDDT